MRQPPKCYGLQYVWRAGRLLGAGASYGERVAQLAWRLYSPRVLPPRYLSSECHDGVGSTYTRRVTCGAWVGPAPSAAQTRFQANVVLQANAPAFVRSGAGVEPTEAWVARPDRF